MESKQLFVGLIIVLAAGFVFISIMHKGKTATEASIDSLMPDMVCPKNPQIEDYLERMRTFSGAKDEYHLSEPSYSIDIFKEYLSCKIPREGPSMFNVKEIQDNEPEILHCANAAYLNYIKEIDEKRDEAKEYAATADSSMKKAAEADITYYSGLHKEFDREYQAFKILFPEALGSDPPCRYPEMDKIDKDQFIIIEEEVIGEDDAGEGVEVPKDLKYGEDGGLYVDNFEGCEDFPDEQSCLNLGDMEDMDCVPTYTDGDKSKYAGCKECSWGFCTGTPNYGDIETFKELWEKDPCDCLDDCDSVEKCSDYDTAYGCLNVRCLEVISMEGSDIVAIVEDDENPLPEKCLPTYDECDLTDFEGCNDCPEECEMSLYEGCEFLEKKNPCGCT